MDSAEQQRRQAQQAAQQAHDSLGHMEAHVAGLTRQLYQVQEEQRQVHQHYEVPVCFVLQQLAETPSSLPCPALPCGRPPCCETLNLAMPILSAKGCHTGYTYEG